VLVEVFLTGGTGFIGGEVARRLRERGDAVRALVRDPARAARLEDLGCELVRGDVAHAETVRRALEGCDAAIHAAAVYEVGVRKSRHPAMRETNVLGTEVVLRAALEARTPKAVYVSTCAAFGNTRGRVVDETYVHPGGAYTSYYEETKVRAHELARRLIAEGLPCVIVQPGMVYGPGDGSDLGRLLERFLGGKLPALPFPELGGNLVHRDDAAAGILLALDRGRPGEAYVLGGQIGTMRDLIETAARVAGRRPPRFVLPAWLVKAAAPLGPLVGPPLGFPPNLREAIRSAEGVTFWASDEKARRELGYRPRPLEQGLREAVAGGRAQAAK
jgi:nucleoside-diphosphate-sugar epimerase